MVVNQTHQELLEKSRTKLGYDKDKQVGIIIIVITANFRQLSQCLRRTQHHIHHHHRRHHHRRRHRDHRQHHHPHRYHHQLSPAARSVGGGRHGGGGGRLLPGEELTFFTLLALNLQQLFFRDIKPTTIFHCIGPNLQTLENNTTLMLLYAGERYFDFHAQIQKLQNSFLGGHPSPHFSSIVTFTLFRAKSQKLQNVLGGPAYIFLRAKSQKFSFFSKVVSLLLSGRC